MGNDAHRPRPYVVLVASLLLTLLASSCSIPSSDTPPVPDTTMVHVLVDMHLAAARAGQQDGLPPSTRDSLLARHGLSPEQYDAALDFYADHPKRYVAVYDSVVDRLSARRPASRNATPAPRKP